MSSTGWCGATVPGEAYPRSPPERAQEQCQTHHHGNTELCKDIYPRPACSSAVFVSCNSTRGVIFHKIWLNWDNIQWFSGAGCEISLTQWVSIHHCATYCSTQINPFYYFWHIIISMTIFFTSQRSAVCEGQRGGQWCQWPFNPRVRRGPSKSQAGVTWPAQTQAAGVEKLKLNDSSLIPFSPDTHVGLWELRSGLGSKTVTSLMVPVCSDGSVVAWSQQCTKKQSTF